MIRAPVRAAAITLIWLSSAQADMIEDCVQSSDHDLQVSGCTAAIRSGRWSGSGLARAYYNRGVAYNHLGRYKRATEDNNQAIGLDPGYAKAYHNRGVSSAFLGQYARAIEDFNRALLLDPGDADAYYNRGVARGYLCQYARAFEDFNRALRLDPGHAKAYYNLAWLIYIEGRAADALPYAEQSVKLEPGNHYGIGTYAHVLAALGRPDEALAEFERAMKVGGAERVKQFQEALVAHGYDPGDINGVYGPRSRTALAACLRAGCRLIDPFMCVGS